MSAHGSKRPPAPALFAAEPGAAGRRRRGGPARIVLGGTIAFAAGLLGLAASLLDIGLIGALDETIATLGILSDAGAVSVLERARIAVATADGSVLLSVLVLLLGALAILVRRRWPGAAIIVVAIAGAATGGALQAAAMLLALAGGLLVLANGPDSEAVEHRRRPGDAHLTGR